MPSSVRLPRRALLSAAFASGLSTFVPRRAWADASAPVALPGGLPASTEAGSRVVSVVRDARGITARLELEHAPFPATANGYADPTVLVFIPHHHRIAEDGTVSMVVHFHGHNTTAERATTAHRLREQLYESKQNAILVVPQLALMAPDSAAGTLEVAGGFGRMLADLRTTLGDFARRDAAGLALRMPGAAGSRDALDLGLGRLCVSAHSGGYHAAACALRGGAVPVQEAYLFDALYADVDVFRDWVVAGHGKPMGARHKLVTYYTAGRTEANSHALFSELGRAGVHCAHEQIEGTLSREELTRAEAVGIRTALAHGSVTSELNSLRDCLYASALRRNLHSSWFEAKHGARRLERRR